MNKNGKSAAYVATVDYIIMEEEPSNDNYNSNKVRKAVYIWLTALSFTGPLRGNLNTDALHTYHGFYQISNTPLAFHVTRCAAQQPATKYM